MPSRFPASRAVAFLCGIGALLAAVASPLEQFDDTLLLAHMIQHLVLMLVAPTFILLGAPAIPIARGVPVQIAKVTIGPLFKSAAVRQFFRRLTDPIVCWLAFVAATWAWHTPAAFQMALRSENWHAVEHGCFLGTALMFWFPVIQPWPSAPRWPRWAMVPYLLLADGQNTILAALLTFSDRVIYPYYSAAPRIGSITPLGDQIIAGAIMWVPGSLYFLVPAALIMLRMLAPTELSRPSRVPGSASAGVAR